MYNRGIRIGEILAGTYRVGENRFEIPNLHYSILGNDEESGPGFEQPGVDARRLQRPSPALHRRSRADDECRAGGLRSRESLR